MPFKAGNRFAYNPDYVRRDQILGITSPKWDDDIDRLEAIGTITLATLELLFDEKFIDPDGRQNMAPTASEILRFMRTHPLTIAHGYAISPYRDDYRVMLEGISIKGYEITRQLREDFNHFCANADVLVVEDAYLYSWWD